jgi:putative transposase
MSNTCTNILACRRAIKPHSKRKKSSTPGSAVRTKKKTCCVKSKTSKQRSQTIHSFPTSVLDSTSSEKACVPFWTKYSTALSKKLLSCTRTDCVDMEPSCWNSSSKRLAQNSWFTVKMKSIKATRRSLQTTSLQSQQCLWLEITENGRQKTEGAENATLAPILKAHKIRVFPSTKLTQAQKQRQELTGEKELTQEQTLRKWMSTARWTYNKCAEEYNKTKAKTVTALRAKHVHNILYKHDNTWVLDTPFEIRDQAMIDVAKAIQAHEAKCKKAGKHTPMSLKFRSRKDKVQGISVLKKNWGHKRKNSKFRDVFNSHVLRSCEALPAKLQHDSRLTRNRLGHYYLCLPMPIETMSENQAPSFQAAQHATMSLDPGVRTFMTGYDADGTIVEWGDADMGRIFRLCYAHDKLQGKWSKKDVQHRQRFRMQTAARRIRSKIRNLVDEAHKKLAKWLCENYRCVLLPEFKSSGMVRRGQRKLHSKTARAMMVWSHYRFRQRLINKAREYPWCSVAITQEPFTSKTCGACGKLHHKLGSSKTFKCPRCGYTADRDANAARNILIRHVTLQNKRTGN